ncbi:MAG: type II toxin-antitoxin system prevent-host-death family antitoxin [Pseudomonadota bacterium]
MPVQVNIHEAKTTLSKLVKAARNGDEVIIAKAGKPMVKLTPIEPAAEEPKPKLSAWDAMAGKMAGQFDSDEFVNMDISHIWKDYMPETSE